MRHFCSKINCCSYRFVIEKVDNENERLKEPTDNCKVDTKHNLDVTKHTVKKSRKNSIFESDVNSSLDDDDSSESISILSNDSRISRHRHRNKQKPVVIDQKTLIQHNYEYHSELIHKNYNFYAEIKDMQQDILIHKFIHDKNTYYYVRLIAETWYKNYIFDKEGFDKLFETLYSVLINIKVTLDTPFVDLNKFVKSYSTQSYVNSVHGQLLQLLIFYNKVKPPKPYGNPPIKQLTVGNIIPATA
jgi:hypothetical protein